LAEKGKEFNERTVDFSLLGELHNEVKAGLVSFISNDGSVYNAKFVTWSSDCHDISDSLPINDNHYGY